MITVILSLDFKMIFAGKKDLSITGKYPYHLILMDTLYKAV